MAAPAPVWLQAGTLAIYGDAGDQVLDEPSPPADGTPWMAGVAKAWEAAVRGANTARLVTMRTGIVLDDDTPALALTGRRAVPGRPTDVGAVRHGAPMTDLETPYAAAARLDAYREVDTLAEWSEWAPLAQALPHAPRLPGVYLLREHDTHRIRYVGMAGERGGGGSPQGLYGRLSVHRTGQGPVSGVGEAALDRALADPEWLEARLGAVRAGRAQRARDWARDAVVRLAPEVCWAACHERSDARHLEVRVDALLRPFGLWRR